MTVLNIYFLFLMYINQDVCVWVHGV